MEKLFKKMMIAMTAIIMVMALPACGPDEPDDVDIVGTWVYTDSGSRSEFTFKSNGSGYLTNYDLDDDDYYDTGTFDYKIKNVDGNSFEIVLDWDDEDERQVLSARLDGKYLYLDGLKFKKK